jgi:hypothetical protein
MEFVDDKEDVEGDWCEHDHYLFDHEEEIDLERD